MKGLILFLDDYNQVAGQLNAHTTNCYNDNQIVVLYENPDLLKEDFFRIKRANIQLATTRKYSFMKL